MIIAEPKTFPSKAFLKSENNVPAQLVTYKVQDRMPDGMEYDSADRCGVLTILATFLYLARY
jgi:hypothetical protein